MSLKPLNDPNSLALDVQGLNSLRQSAKQNSPEALKASAQQFEGLFINMMLKSMRQATAAAGQEQSQDSQLYTSMLDQQLSQTMAQRGIGLADMMLRQMQRQPGALSGANAAGGAAAVPGQQPGVGSPDAAGTGTGANVDANASAVGAAAAKRPLRSASAPATGVVARVQGFIQGVGQHAEQASQRTGLPTSFIVGQAALESGWGRRQIKMPDGAPSHNLFGIKAGPGWNGKVAEVVTTEYVGGVAQRKVAKFRAYDSYAEAFNDYASVLLKNPRYQSVLASGQTVAGFAQGMQKAGYATDPAYADKLARVIRRTMST
ncbi:MAG: flagellar assembly peptidoglycan hydrolase FlgJ [Burkholderiales bacterium]|nr:flagellar assembly peptidoglycan hydrolase FlgJ [Burkholderiales bacterium]